MGVSRRTISELVDMGKLPYEKTGNNSILFCADTIMEWITKPVMDDPNFLDELRKKLWEANPLAMRAIQEFGSRFIDPHEPKLFYLSKVRNKKLGFVYYTRYLVNGKMVPSNWSTGTNDEDAAEKWAIENRERLLTKYFKKDTVKKSYGELYAILKKYYAKDSIYLQIDAKRGHAFGENSRSSYYNMITKQFIPYLRKNRIKTFEEIDTPLLSKFQTHLLSERKLTDGRKLLGVKPKTVNCYINRISHIFDHLIQEGSLKVNPCKSLIRLKRNVEKIRGCYEIGKLKGVFNKTWKNQFSYLLCLVINTTGMRNSEIERMQVKDLVCMDKVNFINISTSKTENGLRMVPLHDFVYRKLIAYIKKTDKKDDDYIFKITGKIKHRKANGSRVYKEANLELAEHTKYTPEKLEQENITFYSGRHFWKTLMNSEKLGDIEEYFMGHKVTRDVSERYNHKNKQGRKKLLEKVRRVFQILDKRIFV